MPSIQVQRSSNVMKLNNIQKLQQTVQLQKEASQTKLDSPFEASSSKIQLVKPDPSSQGTEPKLKAINLIRRPRDSEEQTKVKTATSVVSGTEEISPNVANRMRVQVREI